MKRLTRLLHSTSFKQQLLFAIAVGVACLALLSSLASGWQGARQIRQTLVGQGERVAESLAQQSKLALLYDSAENAENAVNLTLSFPDVTRVELLYPNGKPLIVRGKDPGETRDLTPIQVVREGDRPYLEAEAVDSWRFVAPIITNAEEPNPFQMTAPDRRLVGYVRIVQSKATLRKMMTEMLVVNVAVAVFFFLIFILAILFLTRRLTRPLTQLSQVMALAERDEAKVRAQLSGPRDIADMAHAFNRMMTVLDERGQELRRARDDALQFARLKAEFAATMSHEIRTPLNGVVGTLDMLMATNLPTRQRQFVEIAWDSAQYLLDLLNNILDFSKLEAGKIEIENTGFAVFRMVEEALELLAQEAHQKGLDIGYVASPETPFGVKGDSRLVRQVLINLLGNAVKFTESGEVAVRITTVERDEQRCTLRFEVIDTGVGLSDDAKGRIFDSFTQGDPSTTRRYGGSGLGLSISKQLVALMGGEIGVFSEQNKGSDFWFTLPLDLWTEYAPPIEPLSCDRPMRMLVVDASPTTRLFIEQVLGLLSVKVQAVKNTEQALTALREAASAKTPIDVVLLDIEFTTAAGGGLPTRIHAEPKLGEPRLILMGWYGGDNLPVVAQASAYLHKPLRLERLIVCVRGVVETGTGAPSELRHLHLVPRPRKEPFRVLVVEDSRTNQVIARGMLGMLGCETTVAESGRDAIGALQKQSWDAILMDCNMPQMDGYQTTLAIRELEAQKGGHTPVIAMTANAQSEDITRCLEAGMDDHLSKPLTRSQLAAKLKRWLPDLVLTQAGESGEPGAAEAQGATDSVETLDRMAFAKLREVLGNSIVQAVQPFLEDMPGYLDELQEAASSEDADRLRRVAHAVRGAGGNLGANALAAIAREIEEATPDHACERIDALIARLDAEYSLVKKALIAEIKSDLAQPADHAGHGDLVLVVDDDRSTRSALRFALQRGGFRVEEAGDGSQALALLERIRPDVILMDAVMPGMDGFTACAKLRDLPRGADIPVLMITALESKQAIERAFAAGASDYITKPIHLAVVNQRIKRVVNATRAERHVRHLAYTDVLTGLPNRVVFHEYLNRSLERAAASGHSVAVLFLDLDRFKFVNDTLGHEIGDRLLKSVAQRINHCVRGGDCVARLGGDEFTIVLDDLGSTAAAVAAAQKICRLLGEPFEIEGHDIFISASIGISVYPDDGSDVSTLLRYADTAMYRAKKQNSGFQFYETGMDASVSEHLRMENALRRALERDEFVLFFQPCAQTQSGEICAAEALVRWQYPSHGLVPPNEFIPLAEETGLIVPIGEWVLRTACLQAKQWLSDGIPGLRMAVNISGKQLEQGRFAETLDTILRETDINPAHLTLEITESTLMDHAHETVTTLNQLREIGVHLAIDDFGTGYSSLSYLKRFPVNVLKIDRSFTRDVTIDADDASIVTGIIALAHSLRLQVVAEGVETQEQREFLMGAGCDFMQGYYLSEPLPAEAFEHRVLAKHFPRSKFASPRGR